MALSITIQMPFWTVWETVRQPVMMSGSPSLQWLVRYSKTGLIVLILCWFIRFKTSKQRFVRLVVVQFRGRGRRLGGEADDVSDIDTRVSQLAAVTQISHNKGIRSASTPCLLLLLLMPLLLLPSSLLLTLSSNIQPHLTSIIPPHSPQSLFKLSPSLTWRWHFCYSDLFSHRFLVKWWTPLWWWRWCWCLLTWGSR